MGETGSAEPLYSVREWGDGRVVTLQIHSKYLNYDVSDGLKSTLRGIVQERLDKGTRGFVLDLSKVSIVDSCGVGLMIGLHNLVQGAGGSLWLTGITHFLQKIFRMMHLDQYFQVAASEQDVQKRLQSTVA
jgi:anti-sigma B factor antagonist